MSEIVRYKIPALSVGKFTVTEVGLVIDGIPEYDEWETFGKGLSRVGKAYKWNYGDWMIYGEGRGDWGEMYSQALDETDWEYQSLRNIASTCRRVELYRRRYKLTFEHHAEVKQFEPDLQDYWLDKAEQESLTRDELRAAIRAARLANVENLGEFETILYQGNMLEVVPNIGQFDLIVTDPPYGVGIGWDSVGKVGWDQFEDFLKDCRQWLEIIRAALKPNYNLFLFCSSHFSADIEILFRELELPIQSRIIWHRRSLPKGSHAKNKFVDTWDMILHAGNRELNFPIEWSDAWFDVQVHATPLTSYSGPDKKIHETQKPHELIRRLVEFGSYPGDRILDPFAGSGSVGVACPSDRECILVELDDEYIKRIEKRLGIRARSAP